MIMIMSKDFIEQFIAKAGNNRTLQKGSYLFHRNDPVKSVYVVEKGLIELIRYQQNGTTLTLQRAAEMAVIAEASVYSDIYHCDAVAAQTSNIYELPKAKFFSLLQHDPTLSYLWSSYLAAEVQSSRYRSEILSRKTVAERLDCWQDWNNGKLPPKGQWKDIATQLAVSPEALYRELAKRRNNG